MPFYLGSIDLQVKQNLIKNDLNIDYIFANRLPVKDDIIVGTSEMGYWKIKDDSKVEPLEEVREELRIKGNDVVAVIHDKNDIKLAKHVKKIGGKVIGFMFESHPEVEKECTTIVRSNDLSSILSYIY